MGNDNNNKNDLDDYLLQSLKDLDLYDDEDKEDDNDDNFDVEDEEYEKGPRGELILPTLAMRGIVILEGLTMHFDVGREASIKAIQACMNANRKILLVAQKNPMVEDPTQEDLYQMGIIAEIKQVIKTQDNVHRILVHGEERALLLDLIQTKPYINAVCVKKPMDEYLEEDEKLSDTEIEALTRIVKESYLDYAEVLPKYNKDLIPQIMNEEHQSKLFELIAFNSRLNYKHLQSILEKDCIWQRLVRLSEILSEETQILELEGKIVDKVRTNLDKHQKDFFLREQMRMISEELGEGDDDEKVVLNFRDKLSKIKNMDIESKGKLFKEIDKFSRIPSSSQEGNVQRTYIEACLNLPWDECTKEKIEIPKATKILDSEHYGMVKVKERILEFLAVKKLSPEMKGQIICLVGPPGVGKTSIGKSVAKAMNRKYTRLSLGGVHDEADIRGHRKTYVGSMPGRIMNAIAGVKVNNPLILLDEIDKMGSDFKGDPSSAMLEVLDSEQNNTFRDHYIELPFDLSNVVFITTANDTSTIPAPLLDRMEVIELSSYTREEKFNIAKKHLINKQIKSHGLTSKDVLFAKDSVYALIDSYTREAGVRKLERTIASVCRKVAKEKVTLGDDFTKMKITATTLKDMLGSKKYRPSLIPQENMVGIVTGLAWTSVGGETLEIEVSVMDGTGKIEITGNLGKVMTESSKIACSYVRSIAKQFGIDPDFYKNKDIHIHAPEGAVPKDGPSAGVTMTTALVSALGNIPVRKDVAMTGEISLIGRVMPIGGIKEKSIAAYRAGVKTVIIPYDNKSDIEEFDDVIKDNIEFIPVKSISEVLDIALVFDKKEVKKTDKKENDDFIIMQANAVDSSSISCEENK